ncbi:Hypothetical protein P9303_11261 [Prochlorococcus marinus str. MIT 9303]|uniref:Phytanoyl-CoA dioxygenase (PhyH) n=2 Tax=Prochlorococcus marinus TaxID=1219 RepID=A2C8R5_PROM3|nr:Hypothetical protein P9303_11261 [Prochlorococcus marinus str. MIT 9303]
MNNVTMHSDPKDLLQLKERYEQDGVVHVPGLVSTEGINDLLSWVDEISNSSTLGRHYFESTAHGRVKARTEDFAKHHTPMHDFLTQGRVPKLLEALFGEPPVLFKEKINYKHPGAAGYAPHQDAPAYPFGSLHITMLLALDAADASNGCLEFAKAAHQQGVIAVNADGCLPMEQASQLAWTSMPVAAGDAVFFNSYAPHRSGTNRSDRSRRALYVTYNASSEGNLRSDYYDHKKEALAQGRVSLINHFLGEDVS